MNTTTQSIAEPVLNEQQQIAADQLQEQAQIITPPKTLPSHGGPWSSSQISTDNAVSTTVGITLGRDMQSRGIPLLSKGDLVTIEVLKDGAAHRLIGRASRKRTAYYSKTELAAIGLEVHDTVIYSVHSINGAPPRTGCAVELPNVPRDPTQSAGQPADLVFPATIAALEMLNRKCSRLNELTRKLMPKVERVRQLVRTGSSSKLFSESAALIYSVPTTSDEIKLESAALQQLVPAVLAEIKMLLDNGAEGEAGKPASMPEAEVIPDTQSTESPLCHP